MNNDDLRRRLTLDNREKCLRRRLVEVDWPFLGLFGEELDTTIRQVVSEAISTDRTVVGFIRKLKQQPALFSICLCQALVQTVGQTDHFRLWPDIQEFLRLPAPPTSVEKHQLWLAFRQACTTLGLEVSPRKEGPRFMVDEFLRQVGVSLVHMGDLATKMLRFAHRSGLPDEDDPQGIIAWQEALCATLNPPFSITARDAMELDQKGYYTQAVRTSHERRRACERASISCRAGIWNGTQRPKQSK